MNANPQIATALTPVAIISDDAARAATVTVRTITGESVECTTPCALAASPGYLSVTVSGDEHQHADVTVGASPITIRIEHPSRGAHLLAGTISTALGVAATAAGAMMMGGSNCNADSPTYDMCQSQSDTISALGLAAFTVGLMVVPTGATLLGLGIGEHATRVVVLHPDGTPSDNTTAERSHRNSSLRFAGLGARTLPGGGGQVGVQFAF